MTYGKRIDANQNAIVAALRKIGVSVKITSSIGFGFPDLIIGINGFNYLFELKDGRKTSSQTVLTKPEQKFFNEWQGQVCIIKSIEEAIHFVELVRKGHLINDIKQMS
jgi:hypothetical protein